MSQSWFILSDVSLKNFLVLVLYIRAKTQIISVGQKVHY